MIPAAILATQTEPLGSPTLCSPSCWSTGRAAGGSAERRVQNGCSHMDTSLGLFLLSHSAT